MEMSLHHADICSYDAVWWRSYYNHIHIVLQMYAAICFHPFEVLLCWMMEWYIQSLFTFFLIDIIYMNYRSFTGSLLGLFSLGFPLLSDLILISSFPACTERNTCAFKTKNEWWEFPFFGSSSQSKAKALHGWQNDKHHWRTDANEDLPNTAQSSYFQW